MPRRMTDDERDHAEDRAYPYRPDRVQYVDDPYWPVPSDIPLFATEQDDDSDEEIAERDRIIAECGIQLPKHR